MSNFRTRYSLLPALTLDGFLHATCVEGSFDMELFNQFINELLVFMNPWDPTDPPRSILVLDNCRIHKDPALVEMVKSQYVL